MSCPGKGGSPPCPWYASMRPWGSVSPACLVVEPVLSLGPVLRRAQICEESDMTGDIFVRIDVSKDQLDVHLRPSGEAFAVARGEGRPAGIGGPSSPAAARPGGAGGNRRFASCGRRPRPLPTCPWRWSIRDRGLESLRNGHLP